MYLDDGKEYFMEANWLHNQNVDHWQGWQCNAGLDRLYIAANGDVYSGECKNDYLGNIDEQWHLLDSATNCRLPRCTGCTDDLMVTKQDVVQ